MELTGQQIIRGPAPTLTLVLLVVSSSCRAQSEEGVSTLLQINVVSQSSASFC